MSLTMKIPAIVAWLFCCGFAVADWPTFQQNNQRNAKTSESIDATRLAELWVWNSSFPPDPAWSAPAKWDAYAGIRNLKSMRNYDPVFHVVAVDDHVWFGSSADHHIYCLDAVTGKQQWTFATEGPVRIAPTFWQDKLYVGSDDGFAYCLQAGSGRKIWRTAARECDRRIINNGRFISQWPIRSGVTVENGTAYFTASLLPWQESYLGAVDAESGKHDGDDLYMNRIDYVTMEGPLAISPERLIVAPQGRVSPRLYSLKSGKELGSLTGGGGSFLILTPDSIVHGPGNKTGWLTKSNLKSREKIASFKDANAMVVADDISYTLTDREIIASNIAKKNELWAVETDCNLAMILVGETLFTGGVDSVVAFDAKNGKLLRRFKVDGRAFGLAAADGRLLVSTDTGKIYAFSESQTVEPPPAKITLNSDSNEGLEEVSKIDDEKLLGHWVFQHPHISRTRVNNLAAGMPATIEGPSKISRVGPYQAIQLDGDRTQLPITRQLDKAKLPKEQFTVESWVRIDKKYEWTAFIGCIQDNGAFERGWLLGVANQTKLTFAVCAKGGADKLTYVNSKDDFQLGGWHHVAGTYDGNTMKLYVDGKLANQSDAQSGPIHYPPTAIYELGSYHDDNEDYRLEGMLHEVAVYDRVLDPKEIAGRFDLKAEKFPKPASVVAPESLPENRFVVGPWLQFDSPNSANVHWQTKTAEASIVSILHSNEPNHVFAIPTATTSHKVRLDNLKPKHLHQFQIASKDQQTDSNSYVCDLLFNYESKQEFPNTEIYFGKNQRSIDAAEELLNLTNLKKGICIVLGCGDGSVIAELAKKSSLKIIAFDQDIDRAERLRYEMQLAGLYGGRVSIHIVDSLQQLPITGRIANVVFSESIFSGDETQISFQEAERLLAPGGIAAFTQYSSSTDWFTAKNSSYEIKTIKNRVWAIAKSKPLAGSGSWSHIYGSANNTHFGGESLAKATKADELTVQWIGRPGARYQADRNGRKTPPLSTGGRIFLQGLDRMIAMDQYNGTLLWSLEIPGFRRFNIPRDCGNWCADKASVYAAIYDRCWVVDARDGTVRNHLEIPNNDGNQEWGFIAKTDKLLIGSAVKQGNIWLDFWGKQGWYDGTDGQVAAKVCSDRLFALKDDSKQKAWSYSNGLIINSTISIENETIYFVESRNSKAIAAETRRLDGENFWKDNFLVAVDLQTGTVRWEQPLNVPAGKVALYSACNGGRFVLVSSTDRQYHVHTFAISDGSEVWKKSIPWGKGKADHGSHLSRPAIVGNQLFVRPGVFDLQTGTLSKLTIPVGGCGTYAATENALFFRAGSGKNSAMWNTQRGDYTMWNRMRPDCWLSTIPAGGMLLSPEGGGGCSCGNWMETSVGFIPKTSLESK